LIIILTKLQLGQYDQHDSEFSVNEQLNTVIVRDADCITTWTSSTKTNKLVRPRQRNVSPVFACAKRMQI